MPVKSCSLMHGHVRFELPTFNALDEAIVHSRLDNVMRV